MRLKEDTLRFLKEDRIKLATVAGILTTRPGLIDWVDRNIPEIELITSKSYQVQPNPGNREPIIAEQAVGCFGNAVGLRNPGMDEGYREIEELRNRRPLRALLNISLSANSIDDFILLVKRFESLADILELNFSCPHAREGYGAAIGSDAHLVAEYIREIRQVSTALLFPKLTPNVERIGTIAAAACEAGADGISAINTVGPEQFLEPHSGLPILFNPRGHKGGKSGEWIKEIARAKIKEVRAAVGDRVPIIGMGGVSSGQDVLRLREAGADVVGIGSALGRVPSQDLLPGYIASLHQDQDSSKANRYLSAKRLMEYQTFAVKQARQINPDLMFVRLEGAWEHKAGQFVFLFLPGVGEKPFSIAQSSPLSFLVRRKGDFSRALFELLEGDHLLVRGLYGAPVPTSERKIAYVVAGGTGVAVVPKLVEQLEGQGKQVRLYIGLSSGDEMGLLAVLDEGQDYVLGIDREEPGRVFERLIQDLETEDGQQIEPACFYNIGPASFLKRAMAVEEEMGFAPGEIFVSLEHRISCGVGLCGTCECGGKLLCKKGTFVSSRFLQEQHIEIIEMEQDHHLAKVLK